MNIYVGNLNYRTSEDTIRELFEQYGEVLSVKLVSDRETGRKRGFGFVEMNDEDGAEAIKNLNDKELEGRNLRVNEARQKETQGRGSGGGGNRNRFSGSRY